MRRRLAGALIAALTIAPAVRAQTQRPPVAAPTPNAIISAALERARALGDDGHADSALALLAALPNKHPNIAAATIERRIAADVTRYRLVGKRAPAIEAAHWLNMPLGTTRVQPGERVTLLQFTAHWCAPCQISYTALDAINARYGSQVRIVLVTELYGQFQGKVAKPAAELIADSIYFAKELAAPHPVAIADQPPPPVVPGSYGTVNTNRYGVDPLPQLILVDRHGIVRRIFVGGDFRQSARIEQAIAALLAER